MWRFIVLAALGITIGSITCSEKRVVILSLLFGLLYGGIELVSIALVTDKPSPGRAIFVLGLGVVLAAPVYAVAELWRRALFWVKRWLRRLKRR